MEHLAANQGQTEQELDALRTATVRHVALPDTRVQVTQLLPKMTAHDDDLEAFLQMFEKKNTAVREVNGTGRDCWRPYSLVRLNEPTSPCRLWCHTHSEFKKEILARLGLSPVCAAQNFHDCEYKPRFPGQAAELSRLAQYWLLDGEPTAAQVAERVVVDRLLRALPRTHRQAVGMRNPAIVAELV